ncbi:hypothetical protein PGQ11_015185 [Apiospora arundinis]|uniref:F-box domain-containing protein n=1 Tax=Apiospora arundinis TaxID=335852 RepID=A0ABR2HKN1_9PEZI
MDLPRLLPEILLVLFEHLAPTDLLRLVQASPRCLQMLESMGSLALRRFLEQSLSRRTNYEEAVYFHRPVKGLKALTSLVCAKNAPSDIGFELLKVNPRFEIGDAWYQTYGDPMHPLESYLASHATRELYDKLEWPGPAAHVEELKCRLVQHYGPFFSKDALSDAGRRWDAVIEAVSKGDGHGDAGQERRDSKGAIDAAHTADEEDYRADEGEEWDLLYPKELPTSFGCEVKLKVAGSRQPMTMNGGVLCNILTFHMRACRDVVCFTTKVKSDLAHRYPQYMTSRDADTYSQVLREFGVGPGAVAGQR